MCLPCDACLECSGLVAFSRVVTCVSEIRGGAVMGVVGVWSMTGVLYCCSTGVVCGNFADCGALGAASSRIMDEYVCRGDAWLVDFDLRWLSWAGAGDDGCVVAWAGGFASPDGSMRGLWGESVGFEVLEVSLGAGSFWGDLDSSRLGLRESLLVGDADLELFVDIRLIMLMEMRVGDLGGGGAWARGLMIMTGFCGLVGSTQPAE